MKKFWIFIVIIFLGTALSAATLYDGKGRTVKYAGRFSARPVTLPQNYFPRENHLRGVWVATVENLDWPKCESAAKFKQEYIKLLNELQKRKFNAVFFQVRPSCDAFYPSAYNVYSRYLTGVEGRGFRDFDPLRFMVAETRRRGMEFHAWLNPYRVAGNTNLSKSAYLRTLSSGNFARKNPGLVISFSPAPGKNTLFLNPGEPAVMSHLINTVSEIVRKYPVNAIHFDDYFYPYDALPASADRATYLRVNPNKLSLDDWRRHNVDMLVARCSAVIKAEARKQQRKIEFGISPFGIWANAKNDPRGSLTGGKESFFIQHADTRKWVKHGYIDYIIPQLYWDFGHDTAAYAALCDWWANVVTGTRVKLYIGHAVYRLGKDFPAGELFNQLRYNQKHPQITGAVFFRYRFIVKPDNRVMKNEISRITGYWKKL